MREYPKDKQNQMKSLYELANEAYLAIKGDIPYSNIDEFIQDGSKAAEFIRAILQDDEFKLPNKKSGLYDVAKLRARHSVITFLIGLVFFKYENFGGMIVGSSYMEKANGYMAAIRLWMLVALYHDYGYSLSDIKSSTVDLKLNIKYYLLDDTYSNKRLEILQQFSIYHNDALAYTYDEIEKYDLWSRQWRQRQEHEKEKVDHGILGGIRIFNRLIIRALKMPQNQEYWNELLAIKASCLTIAQHNMYKSDSRERDFEYGPDLSKLHSTSEFVVNSSTPLLLLLSLVDTFECIKNLSKGKNPKEYLQTHSVLSSIDLLISEDELIIDFSKLDKRIESKKDDNLISAYTRYKENLSNLNHWTSFTVTDLNNGSMKIEMDLLKDSHKHEITSKELVYA